MLNEFNKFNKFTATKDKSGKLFIKPNFERKQNGDLVCHVPSFKVINKLTKETDNGIRNIQQI